MDKETRHTKKQLKKLKNFSTAIKGATERGGQKEPGSGVTRTASQRRRDSKKAQAAKKEARRQVRLATKKVTFTHEELSALRDELIAHAQEPLNTERRKK